MPTEHRSCLIRFTIERQDSKHIFRVVVSWRDAEDDKRLHVRLFSLWLSWCHCGEGEWIKNVFFQIHKSMLWPLFNKPFQFTILCTIWWKNDDFLSWGSKQSLFLLIQLVHGSLYKRGGIWAALQIPANNTSIIHTRHEITVLEDYKETFSNMLRLILLHTNKKQKDKLCIYIVESDINRPIPVWSYRCYSQGLLSVLFQLYDLQQGDFHQLPWSLLSVSQ